MDPISVQELTKRYKRVTAVDQLSFNVRPATVTGFLGRNGAGKTTTLRMLLGLARPSSGRALINGRSYHELDNPCTTVGAVLEARSFHPGRSGRNHLRWVATTIGAPTARIDELLALVDLTAAANRRVGGYSLGMRQRLALAAALLGDPQILVLDEPANGLDPQGMRWLRDFLREQARGGKTVLVSSHVLAELAQFADDAVVLERGKLVWQGSIEEITRQGNDGVRVRTPRAVELAAALEAADGKISDLHGEEFVVSGLSIDQVGDRALAAGISVHSLAQERDSLEDVFLRLTDSRASDQRKLEPAA